MWKWPLLLIFLFTFQDGAPFSSPAETLPLTLLPARAPIACAAHPRIAGRAAAPSCDNPASFALNLTLKKKPLSL